MPMTRSLAVVPVRSLTLLGATLALFTACNRGPSGNGAPAPGATRTVAAHATPVADSVTVYKDASCGCCRAWVQYMRDSGYAVRAVDVAAATLDSVKQAHGVPAGAASCHTALVGRYVVEGHVPADLVARMLRERPDIVGLAVPGMVTGSPGMEGPDPQHYTVVAMLKDGSTRPYATR